MSLWSESLQLTAKNFEFFDRVTFPIDYLRPSVTIMSDLIWPCVLEVHKITDGVDPISPVTIRF